MIIVVQGNTSLFYSYIFILFLLFIPNLEYFYYFLCDFALFPFSSGNPPPYAYVEVPRNNQDLLQVNPGSSGPSAPSATPIGSNQGNQGVNLNATNGNSLG